MVERAKRKRRGRGRYVKEGKRGRGKEKEEIMRRSHNLVFANAIAQSGLSTNRRTQTETFPGWLRRHIALVCLVHLLVYSKDALTSLGECSYQRSYCTSGPVSTGMGDRRRRANHLSILPSHPGQLSLLPSAGREIPAKRAVMLCGRRVGRYGSFQMWINVWVAGKTVWSIVNTCHAWAF